MMRYFLFWLQAFASSVKNPLLCRLLTSTQSLHELLQGALSVLHLFRSYPSMEPDRPRLDQPGASLVLYRSHVEQISPGKNMILPYTTAAFTLPQRSGRASSCGADSPWGSALICSFCSSARRFALGLLSDARSPLRPCRRLVLFKWSVIMTTLQTMYRGLAPHKIMPMPGTHHGLQWMLAIACPTEHRR
jgi:hypothetical protein